MAPHGQPSYARRRSKGASPAQQDRQEADPGFNDSFFSFFSAFRLSLFLSLSLFHPPMTDGFCRPGSANNTNLTAQHVSTPACLNARKISVGAQTLTGLSPTGSREGWRGETVEETFFFSFSPASQQKFLLHSFFTA